MDKIAARIAVAIEAPVWYVDVTEEYGRRLEASPLPRDYVETLCELYGEPPAPALPPGPRDARPLRGRADALRAAMLRHSAVIRCLILPDKSRDWVLTAFVSSL